MSAAKATAPLTNYRIQVTATRGEQLVVERQYQASPGQWVTVSKYLTADINRLPKKHEAWAEEVAAVFQNSVLPRCLICDFPLAATVEDGCVPGNCSYRPADGSPEYYRIEARRRALRASWDQLDGTILSDVPCASVEAGIVCGQPQSAHTPEAARGDVGMDHDFVDPENVLPSEY